MKKFVGCLCICIGLIMVVSATSWATLITVNHVVGSWQNSLPPAVTTIVNGDPISTVSWGTGRLGPSSYVFESQIPPVVTVDVPPTPSDWIAMGEFTHNNFPIVKPYMTSVELLLDTYMDVGGTDVTQPFIYTFLHNETTNIPGDPEASKDIVTILAPSAGSFLVDNVLYTLELAFSQDQGDSITHEFQTYEEEVNTAGIYGRFTAVEAPTVPEPATMMLFGIGLLGLGAIGRRKFMK